MCITIAKKNVTGPVTIGHVGSQNLTTLQTFVTHNFLFQYGMATQFSEIAHNLTGFLTHFTEPKYYISVLRYVSSNCMVHFSPHALFSQAQSQIVMAVYVKAYTEVNVSQETGSQTPRKILSPFPTQFPFPRIRKI